MLVKKWKPNYATIEETLAPENISPDREPEDATLDDGDVAGQKKKKKKDKSQKLSTKGIIRSF